MKYTVKSAFTLAEVLISLTIIGVIAALTVPALIQNTQKQEYVTALKKAYSTLSQATNQIIMEEGSPESSCETCNDGWASSVDKIYNLYKTKLNIIKDCGGDAGCFPQKSYKFLNGSRRTSNFEENSDYKKIVLNNGMQVVFSLSSKQCTADEASGEPYCQLICVDVNGEKGPNIAGRDFFAFKLKENGLYPSGCVNEEFLCFESDGGSCACKVLREGAMNY